MESSTQTLWLHLMAIANKSGWPEWFLVKNPTLEARVGFSENSLKKHRNYLIQNGRIEYRNQGKHKAGKYRIISFHTTHLTATIAVNHEVKGAVKDAVNHEVKGAAVLNDLKDLNSFSVQELDREKEKDMILGWVNTFGLKKVGHLGLDQINAYLGVVETGVIELAIKAAEGKHLNYFLSTINDWITSGKTTVAQVLYVPEKGEPPAHQSGQKSRSKGGYNSSSTGKPKMTVVKDDGPPPEISPEEFEQMMRRANELKYKQIGDSKKAREGNGLPFGGPDT